MSGAEGAPTRPVRSEPGASGRNRPSAEPYSATPRRDRNDETELDLRAFLAIMRRRLWVVVLVPTLVAGAAVASSARQAPRYRATADILLTRTSVENLFNPMPAGAGDPSRLLADQIRVVRSLQVTNLVEAQLGSAPAIKASGSSTEDVITLTAVDPSAKRAAAVVNAYADAYLRYRVSSGVNQNATAQTELRRQIDATRTQLNLLDQAVAAQPAVGATPGAPSPRDQLLASQAAQRTPLDTQLAAQGAALSNLQAAAAVDQGGAQLLAPATVPPVPFAPKPIRTGLLGLGVGAMLGLALAFLLDYLDNRIRGKDDLERAADNLPVVALIPTLPEWRDATVAHVVSIEQPRSGSAEAYRSLRTSVDFLGLDRSVRILQVTSPTHGEGKTTTVANLAVALARAGRRVIVVDCDLRRPRIHQFFGLRADIGFTSVLLGEASLRAGLLAVPDLPGLTVLPSGPVPPNPSELLAGRTTTDILQTLQSQADFILVDSPPVLPVSDAAVIASRVDATLMVVMDNQTQRKQLGRALELLRQIDAVVLGTVLNRMTISADDYGYWYSSRCDGPAEPPPGGGVSTDQPSPGPALRPQAPK